MNEHMEMMFGKKKSGARRLSKESAGSALQQVRRARKGKTQEFFRLMSIGLSSPHTPVLRRHD